MELILKQLQFLIAFACIIIICAGLRVASSVIVPFLLAIFIAVIITPIINLLEKIKIPRIIAFIITSICFFAILIFTGKIVVNAVFDFSIQLPHIQQSLTAILEKSIEKFNSYDLFQIDINKLGFDTKAIFNSMSGILKKTGTIASKSFFIFLLVAFMLFESKIFQEKIKFLEKNNPQTKIFVDIFITNLKKYLMIKTITSISTGLIIGILLYIIKVPYAPLWGICAFILNYIPTIGSIVAAIPTIFVALATGDVSLAIWTIGIYLVVNVTIGNIIEPRFMGEGLGISTILVLVSLLIWGFIFGLGGLFLAIPLTMTIQIALASNPKTKNIATLLSNKV